MHTEISGSTQSNYLYKARSSITNKNPQNQKSNLDTQLFVQQRELVTAYNSIINTISHHFLKNKDNPDILNQLKAAVILAISVHSRTIKFTDAMTKIKSKEARQLFFNLDHMKKDFTSLEPTHIESIIQWVKEYSISYPVAEDKAYDTSKVNSSDTDNNTNTDKNNIASDYQQVQEESKEDLKEEAKKEHYPLIEDASLHIDKIDANPEVYYKYVLKNTITARIRQNDGSVVQIYSFSQIKQHRHTNKGRINLNIHPDIEAANKQIKTIMIILYKFVMQYKIEDRLILCKHLVFDKNINSNCFHVDSQAHLWKNNQLTLYFCDELMPQEIIEILVNLENYLQKQIPQIETPDIDDDIQINGCKYVSWRDELAREGISLHGVTHITQPKLIKAINDSTISAPIKKVIVAHIKSSVLENDPPSKVNYGIIRIANSFKHQDEANLLQNKFIEIVKSIK